MSFLGNIKTFSCAAAVALIGASALVVDAADASTTINSTGSTNISGFSVNEVYAASGANVNECTACGAWWHGFNFLDTPGTAEFTVSINNAFIDQLVNPRIVWINGTDLTGTVTQSVVILRGVGGQNFGGATLLRNFEGPFIESAVAAFRWDNAPDGSLPFSFDVNVQTIPLPAAGWLLMTAVGGLAVAARRRKAAA